MAEPIWSCFAALRDTAAASQNDALLVNISVEGQLMHRRRISRKCSFFDLASVAAGVDNQRERLEVILKIIDGELSLEEVDAIRYRLKLGDIVRVRGFVECLEGGISILLHARDILVVQAWKEENPGVPFLPLPTVDSMVKKRQPGGNKNQDKNITVGVVQSDTEQRAIEITSERVHCKFWINSKTCQHGDKCELFHVSDAERKNERAKWLTERMHLKRIRAHIDEDPLDPHGKIGKQQRAQVLLNG